MRKKYKIRTPDGRLIRFGAVGYRIAPGTPKGDRYCARSLGQVRKFPEAAADRYSPLSLSRKKWRCVGEKSIKIEIRKKKS